MDNGFEQQPSNYRAPQEFEDRLESLKNNDKKSSWLEPFLWFLIWLFSNVALFYIIFILFYFLGFPDELLAFLPLLYLIYNAIFFSVEKFYFKASILRMFGLSFLFSFLKKRKTAFINSLIADIVWIAFNANLAFFIITAMDSVPLLEEPWFIYTLFAFLNVTFLIIAKFGFKVSLLKMFAILFVVVLLPLGSCMALLFGV